MRTLSWNVFENVLKIGKYLIFGIDFKTIYIKSVRGSAYICPHLARTVYSSAYFCAHCPALKPEMENNYCKRTHGWNIVKIDEYLIFGSIFDSISGKRYVCPQCPAQFSRTLGMLWATFMKHDVCLQIISPDAANIVCMYIHTKALYYVQCIKQNLLLPPPPYL